MDIKSNFPNQYRATNVTILIRTPPQFVNAKLMSDYPTHRLHTTKDNHLILEITNLFGSSSTSACISVALTDLNFPKSKFHSFEISFEIANFSFAQLKVEKFKLLRPGFWIGVTHAAWAMHILVLRGWTDKNPKKKFK